MPGNLKITRKVPGVKPNYGVPEEFSLFEGEADNRQEVSPAQQALSNPELMTIVFSSLATSSIAKLLPVDDAFYDAGTQLIYHSITLDPSKPFTTAHSPAYTCAITRSQRLEAQTGNRMRKGHFWRKSRSLQSFIIEKRPADNQGGVSSNYQAYGCYVSISRSTLRPTPCTFARRERMGKGPFATHARF
jgi:hypothetical protein